MRPNNLLYCLFLCLLTKNVSTCNMFNFTRHVEEIDKKLPGIWNDEHPNRTKESCHCGTNDRMADPPWILFINLKPDIKLNYGGMTGCVGTIITSNLIATSYHCVHRKSSRSLNIFDTWNGNTKNKSASLPNSENIVPCNNPQIEGQPTLCQMDTPEENVFDVPPFLTKDDLIVSSKPFGEGETFKVIEIIFQEPYVINRFWQFREELKQKRFKEQGRGDEAKVRSIEADILLLKLHADFTANQNFNPICIPEHDELNFLNQLGEYYGAGTGMHPSSKSVDVNAGIVFGKDYCKVYDHPNEIKINENKADQISSLCMIWRGGWDVLGQILGGGPLVIESESSPPISFLAGVMNWLGANNIEVIASFTNILPVLKYIKYRAHQHKSKWCRIPTHLKFCPRIQSTAQGTYRPWVSGTTLCNKQKRIQAVTMFRRRSDKDENYNEVERPDVKIEFLTEDDKIVESYYAEKLCECTPLINHRGFGVAKLKANGVCLKLFIDENKCSTYNNFNEIPEISGEDTAPAEKLAKVKSFQLCQPFISCYNISVFLYKISINERTFVDALNSVTPELVYIPGVYKENWEHTDIPVTAGGPVKLLHTLEIEMIPGVPAIQSSGIEIKLNEGGQASQLLRTEFLKTSMMVLYDTKTHNGSGTTRFESEEYTTTYSTTKTKLDPCNNIKGSYKVSFANNVNFEYEVYIKIKGMTECGTPLYYKNLYNFVPPGFQPTRWEDRDDFHLVAIAKAKIIASFNVVNPTHTTYVGDVPGCCHTANKFGGGITTKC